MIIEAIEKPITETFPVAGDEDGATITVRLLSPGEIEDIAEAARSFEMALGKKTDPKIKFSLRAEQVGVAMAALVGWDKFWADAAKKTPLVCNEESKRRVIERVKGFLPFVVRCHNKLQESHHPLEVDLEKN